MLKDDLTVPEIAYVNGEFLPLERATVHVEDRGYQFADAVYEFLRTYGGQPFAVTEHLQRLFFSLDAIGLKHNFTAAQLADLIHEAVRRAAFPETAIYLQVSRGQAKRHRGIPANYAPTLVITARELASTAHLCEAGIKLITVPDQRWARCDIKTVGLLANVLAYQAARQAGASDAIFCEADGTVNEATAGNIFIVTPAGQFATPAKSHRLLAGVTRDKLLQAAAAAGISTAERDITKTELLAAAEVILSSSTAEVVPVIAVDGTPIGTGRPGPVGQKIYAEFLRRLP